MCKFAFLSIYLSVNLFVRDIPMDRTHRQILTEKRTYRQTWKRRWEIHRHKYTAEYKTTIDIFKHIYCHTNRREYQCLSVYIDRQTDTFRLTDELSTDKELTCRQTLDRQQTQRTHTDTITQANRHTDRLTRRNTDRQMCRHRKRYIIKKQTDRQPNNRCTCIMKTERLNDKLIDKLRQMCRH